MDVGTRKCLGYHALPIKGKTHLERWADAVVKVKEILSRQGSMGDVRHHFVEDRLEGFRGGTTQHTLMVLSAINAVVSHQLSQDGPVVHLAPVTAKRLAGLVVPKGGDKKALAVVLARSKDPDFPYKTTKGGNLAPGVGDMADAFLLALSGAKILSGEVTLGEKPKARRANRGPRKAAGLPKEG